MPESYIETISMRLSQMPEVGTPSFADSDCDTVFGFKAKVKLVQIQKNVQNAVHNRHDYVFEIIGIKKIEKEIE